MEVSGKTVCRTFLTQKNDRNPLIFKSAKYCEIQAFKAL